MKGTNKKALYRIPKRDTRPHCRQSNERFSGTSYNYSHIIVSSERKASNRSFYNGNVSQMHPSILGSQQMGSSHANQKRSTVSKKTSQTSVPSSIQNCERARSQSPKRKWSREDAIRAIQFEEDICKQNPNGPCLIIHFPDPPLNPEIVKGFSKEIDMVHFENNSCPRYCFVRLKSNANTTKIMNNISKIRFGAGYLSAEIREDTSKFPCTKPELVDPYTLYVGNLSLSATVETMKHHFPGASRCELAFKSKQKQIRCAFIHFNTLEKAIEAFKQRLHLQIDGRTIVLRFRRAKLNNCSHFINSTENQATLDKTMTNDSITENDCYIIENNRNTSSSIVVQSNYQSSGSVIDLTTKNINMIGNYNKGLPTSALHNETIFKVEEFDEDKNPYHHTPAIKEELYDSEYSCEDDCSSSYYRGSWNNLKNTNIKTEADQQGQPFNSNRTRTTVDINENCHGEFGRHCYFTASAPIKYCQTNGTIPVADAKEIHYGNVQDRNRTKIKDRPRVPETTSISEKKYIENLYDQLNSAKVFKTESHSEFDELEEMLRDFD
ncbi:uncharacterized protein Pof isoform X2 [Eurosta solidaginis]|uniref:uncharacterized protein Pof isoform X2 n=1 Tax=Eurosta solidaginis TaxID=178769 RepID=UPI00353122C2